MAPSLKIETFEEDKKKGKSFVSPCHCVRTPTVNSHTQIEPLYGLPRVVDILSSSPRKICCAHRPGQVGGLSARVVVCHPPRLMPPLPDNNNNNNNKGKEGGRTRRFFSIHRNPWNVYNTRRERETFGTRRVVKVV